MAKFLINTDGASRGNPGAAASTFIIKNEKGEFLAEGGEYLGIATNNEAEYQGVIFALEKVRDSFTEGLPASIEIKADSQLVVSQLNGLFKIKNPRMREFIDKIRNLEKEVGEVKYTYIPRSENSQADALANRILDQVSN